MEWFALALSLVTLGAVGYLVYFTNGAAAELYEHITELADKTHRLEAETQRLDATKANHRRRRKAAPSA